MDEKLKNKINELTDIIDAEEDYIEKIPGEVIDYEYKFCSGKGYRVEGYDKIPIYEYSDVKKSRHKYHDNARKKAKKELIKIFYENVESKESIKKSKIISRKDFFDYNHPTIADTLEAGKSILSCAGIIGLWAGIGYGGFKLINYLAQLSD